MKLHASLTLSPGDTRPPSGIFVEALRHPGRPRKFYRLRVRSPEDAAIARRLGLAVYLLTPEHLTALGAPTQLRPHLLLAQEIEAAVDTEFPRIVFRYGEFARSPRIEDVVVALLSVDPLTARLLAVRNRKVIDPGRLAERVVQEGVAGPATRVGLQLVAAEIPQRGPTWPRELLEEHDRGHTVTGIRA